jgi:outer membrane murein-binding lipoprotein Lpp
MKKRSLPIGAAIRKTQNKKTKLLSTSVSELEDKIAQLERELNSSSSSENSSSSESDDESEESDNEDKTKESNKKEIVEVLDENGNVVVIQSRLVGEFLSSSSISDLISHLSQRKKLLLFHDLSFQILIAERLDQNKNEEIRKLHNLHHNQQVDLKKVFVKCYKITNQLPQNEDHFGVEFVPFKHKMNKNSFNIVKVKFIKLHLNMKENLVPANYVEKNLLHLNN